MPRSDLTKIRRQPQCVTVTVVLLFAANGKVATLLWQFDVTLLFLMSSRRAMLHTSTACISNKVANKQKQLQWIIIGFDSLITYLFRGSWWTNMRQDGYMLIACLPCVLDISIRESKNWKQHWHKNQMYTFKILWKVSEKRLIMYHMFLWTHHSKYWTASKIVNFVNLNLFFLLNT